LRRHDASSAQSALDDRRLSRIAANLRLRINLSPENGQTISRKLNDMDNEVVGNTTGTSNAPESAELAEVAAEFASHEADFRLGLTARLGAPGEMDALDQAVEGTAFAMPSAETGGTLSLLDLADGKVGNGQEGFFDFLKAIVNAIKRRTQKTIAKTVSLVRKYAKYASCIPKVLKAVRSFAAKQYGTALKDTLAAFACIQSKA
jgi:hypothetical protein